MELNYKILVAEEPGIVSFEIEQRLKNSGFNIIEKAGQNNILNLVKNKTPDFTIACLRSLIKIMSPSDFYEIWGSENIWSGNTDTIIFDKAMHPLAAYPKPFDSNDIIDFITSHLNLKN